MELMKRWHHFILLFCCSANLLFASSISTPASTVAQWLAEALDRYQKDHDGQLPKKWSELEGTYLSLQTVESELRSPMDNKFVLIQNSAVEMVTPNKNVIFKGGTIVAVSSPVSEDRREKGLGRYVIWKSKEGFVRASWLYEDTVVGQFQKAGLKVPSGPLMSQPSSLDPNTVLRKYAEQHFKNPDAPTPDELKQMEKYFLEQRDNKAPKPKLDNESPPEQTTLKPRPSEPEPQPETVKTNGAGIPWLLVVLGGVAAVIVGILGFGRLKS